MWFTATAAVVFGGVVGLVVWLAAPPPARPSVAITELDDGVRIGYPTAPVTIDIFDEPICPPCSRFVTSSSADLQRAVNAGKIVLRYHLLNFLDGRSASGDYSTRAVAASFCIAETKTQQPTRTSTSTCSPRTLSRPSRHRPIAATLNWCI